MNNRRKKIISPYIVGPPILTLDGFYGRQEEINEFFYYLNTPQMHSQRILGTWRSGKSSFLRHIARPAIYRNRIITKGLPAILAYVNLQTGVTDPLFFFQEVALALAAAAPKRKDISVPGNFIDMRDFDLWIENICSRFRVVVLLDEFEALSKSAKFDLAFFGKLRAMASSLLVWATASYPDVTTLSKPPGTKDLSSPLFNIFHSSPIYLKSFRSDEAEELILKPAQNCGIKFTSDEVNEIRHLAGDMPFLLQAVSEKWLLALSAGIPVRERCEWVKKQLFEPGNIVRKNLGVQWAELTFRAQRILRLLADGKVIQENKGNNDTISIMENYGHLVRRNGGLYPGSGILQQWIRNFSNTTTTTPHVFIGHGRSKLWLEVKNVIQDEFHLIPVCYESEPRAGESIVPILKEMIEKSDFAIIVVTKEDKVNNKIMRPRQNVVHEAGLFQGNIGFEKVILLVQKGVEFLSNLDGEQYIPFKGDDIKSTFLGLQAYLRRENLLI